MASDGGVLGPSLQSRSVVSIGNPFGNPVMRRGGGGGVVIWHAAKRIKDEEEEQEEEEKKWKKKTPEKPIFMQCIPGESAPSNMYSRL
jgi:hypothetical protein